MNYLIGIDGGGTRCRLAVSDGRSVLSKVEGPSSNPYGAGWDHALKTLESLINASISKAGITAGMIKALVLGSAGMGGENSSGRAKAFLQSLAPNASILVTGDHVIFLAGGIGQASGLGVIAGTGSIAFGRNEAGEEIRSGGYGWRLGDEGSGFWIAKEAIRRTLLSSELMDIETSMTGKLKEFFGLNVLRDAIYMMSDEKLTKAEIAAFAPIVTSYAEAGDPLAIDIEEKASASLCMQVESVAKRLGKPYVQELVCGGGAMEHDGFLRSAFDRRMKQQLPQISILPKPRHSALDGALIMARSLIST